MAWNSSQAVVTGYTVSVWLPVVLSTCSCTAAATTRTFVGSASSTKRTSARAGAPVAASYPAQTCPPGAESKFALAWDPPSM